MSRSPSLWRTHTDRNHDTTQSDGSSLSTYFQVSASWFLKLKWREIIGCLEGRNQSEDLEFPSNKWCKIYDVCNEWAETGRDESFVKLQQKVRETSRINIFVPALVSLVLWTVETLNMKSWGWDHHQSIIWILHRSCVFDIFRDYLCTVRLSW